MKSSTRFLEHFHGFENILFAFFAESGEVSEPPLFCDSLDVGDGAGFKVGPQEGNLLRPKRLELQQIQNRRRIFLEQLPAQRVVAGLNDFLQMLDHAVADSWKFFELFRFLHELFDGFGQAVDQFGGLLITAVSADDGAVDFQKLRGFPEDAGDLFVVHGEAIINPGRGN